MSQKNYKRGGYQKHYQTKIYIEKKPSASTEEKTNVQEPGKHIESQRDPEGKSFETKEIDSKPKKHEFEEKQVEKYFEKKNPKKTAPRNQNQPEFSEKYEKKNMGRDYDDHFEEEYKSNAWAHQGKKPYNGRHVKNNLIFLIALKILVRRQK